jgi:DNA-directed RNA polymerase subunit M/transcription elongation factor TFIIS
MQAGTDLQVLALPFLAHAGPMTRCQRRHRGQRTRSNHRLMASSQPPWSIALVTHAVTSQHAIFVVSQNQKRCGLRQAGPTAVLVVVSPSDINSAPAIVRGKMRRRLCPQCGSHAGQFLTDASREADVDYYECEHCGETWMVDPMNPTRPQRSMKPREASKPTRTVA